MSDERLSAYLLGELEGSERERFERELAADPRLAAEARRLAPVVERLSALDESAWQPVHPPDLAPNVFPPARTRAGARLRPVVAAAAAAVLLALGVAAGMLLAGDDRPAPATQAETVALEPVAGSGQRAAGRARLEGDRIVISVKGAAPSGARRFYEVWLLNSTNDLVALGAFRVPASGDASVTLPVPVRAGDFRFVDVSLEPEDGDPRHSGASVLRAGVPRS